MDYSERLSYDQWWSLLDILRGLPNFRVLVQSSPGDVLKHVYKISSKRITGDVEDSITFIMTDNKVVLDVQSPRDTLYKRFVRVLFEDPMTRIPLYINDKDMIIKEVALWRLKNNI